MSWNLQSDRRYQLAIIAIITVAITVAAMLGLLPAPFHQLRNHQDTAPGVPLTVR